jgi:hypothetical protein
MTKNVLQHSEVLKTSPNIAATKSHILQLNSLIIESKVGAYPIEAIQ